jgi:hypothetical protein
MFTIIFILFHSLGYPLREGLLPLCLKNESHIDCVTFFRITWKNLKFNVHDWSFYCCIWERHCEHLLIYGQTTYICGITTHSQGTEKSSGCICHLSNWDYRHLLCVLTSRMWSEWRPYKFCDVVSPLRSILLLWNKKKGLIYHEGWQMKKLWKREHYTLVSFVKSYL